MKLLSRWLRSAAEPDVEYDSLLWLESDRYPGVEFSIRKISLSQRIALSSRVRELTLRNEFLQAGDLKEKLEAALADLLVQRLYVEWATVHIKGLIIDGKTASIGSLIEHGPESLVYEMADAINKHLELSDSERKNF